MSKKRVRFGMFWQEYGYQEIDLPDDIDDTDEKAVKDYIKSVWDDIPLPTGDYVSGSDELDEDFGVQVFSDNSGIDSEGGLT